MQIFIAYARPDQAIVQRLADHFRRNGFDVFLDVESSELGERFSDSISDAILQSDAIVFVVSPHSVGSSWALRELALAEDEDKPIFPILVDPEVTDRRLPYALATRQQLTLVTPSAAEVDDAVRLIRDALRTRRLRPGDVRSGTDERPLSPSEFAETVELVVAAFADAGRLLQRVDGQERLGPEPVWVSRQTIPTSEEVERFGRKIPFGRIGYFIHTGTLPPATEITLDQMRVGGTPIATLTVRALRAALADNRVGVYLAEVERNYGNKDNLFDTANALVDERFLFGRTVLLNSIGSAIARHEHTLVTGLRKVGKTSLINILRQNLTDHPVCTIDPQLFERSSPEWPRELFAMLVVAFDRWGRVEHADWPFTPTPPSGAANLRDHFDQRFRWLVKRGHTKPMVVLFDEIERVFPRPGHDDEAERWIVAAGALRALAQGANRHLVLVAADLRATANRENRLGNVGTNPWFSLLHERPVSLLDHDALGDMVESLARAMGIDAVTKTFIEGLYELSGGHPFLARYVAAEAYRQRSDVYGLSGDDLAAGLATLEDEARLTIQLKNNFWDWMNDDERSVASRLAHGRAPRRRFAGAAKRAADDEAYAALTSQGIVENGSLRIGLLARWIRERGSAV